MGKKKTTANIIEQFKLVHGSKYDYSLVNYVNDHTKVVIICTNHGNFEQSPAGHYRMKQGCPKCSNELNGTRCRKSSDVIKTEIQTIYGFDAFDFTEFNYVNAHTKVKLKCIKHSHWFESIPGSLTKKKLGCKYCELEKRSINQHNKWIDRFINDCTAIHGNQYDYSKVKYVNGSTHVTIICSIHGEFNQLPTIHRLAKAGCPACKYSKGEHKIMQYLNFNNIKYTPQHKVTINDSNHYFDFYLPAHNLIIEYNGKQHYVPVKWFGSASTVDMDKSFRYVQCRDEIKRQYCLDTNIDLLVISYLEFDQIFNILDMKLTHNEKKTNSML
jgi:hypothetical protein